MCSCIQHHGKVNGKEKENLTYNSLCFVFPLHVMHVILSGFYRNGVELVFIGTKGGLTRYKALTENLTDT